MLRDLKNESEKLSSFGEDSVLELGDYVSVITLCLTDPRCNLFLEEGSPAAGLLQGFMNHITINMTLGLRKRRFSLFFLLK